MFSSYVPCCDYFYIYPLFPLGKWTDSSFKFVKKELKKQKFPISHQQTKTRTPSIQPKRPFSNRKWLVSGYK